MSLLTSFGDLSIDPNPDDDILPLNDISAKSAKFASIFPTAAHPPSNLMSESLNSLNQTSPERLSPMFVEGFFKPKLIVLILARDGLPLIENLYFFSPGNELIGENSSIKFKSSSKYIVSEILILSSIIFNLILNNFSISKSIEFSSVFQTSSDENLDDSL